MKKMLSTLTAIALSIALVSTMNARQRGKAAGAGIARDINASSKKVADKMAPKEDKDAALDELIAIIKENPDELQLAQLFILRKQKENEVSSKKDEISAMKVGWFDFGNVDYKKAKGELAILMTELKNLNQEIANQSKVVGPEMSGSVKFAIGATIASAGLFAVDMYLGGALRKAAMEKAGKAWEVTAPYRAKAGELAQQARESVGRGAARVRQGVFGTPATPTIQDPGLPY